jgi:DNA gyrase subunit A
LQVVAGQEIMLISSTGTLVRTPVDEISVLGRNTQGVRLIRLEEEEKVVAIERLAEKEEGETEVAPEVAAARAEQQTVPLAEEDLGEEAAAEQDDDADDEDDADPEADADADEKGPGSDPERGKDN